MSVVLQSTISIPRCASAWISLSNGKETSRVSFNIGDSSTSDVVVRLRTQEGRDCRFYCHSEVLIENSKYFAERLSEDWPTCQIIDSRSCVEVYCQELDFDFHVTAIRMFYVKEPHTWYGVRNALGILQVAIHLGCQQMICACVDYLEAVPWEEAEEEEILKTIPKLGEQYNRILSRLQPINQASLVDIFITTIRFATSPCPKSLHELKSSAQEQLEYLLTEDDDPPLFTLENQFIRSQVKDCINGLLSRFSASTKSMLGLSIDPLPETDIHEFWSHLCDFSWACQTLGKMEMKDLVQYWVDASVDLVRAAEVAKSVSREMAVEMKMVEVVYKVFETIGFGNAIVPTKGRTTVVKVWLPFIQRVRPLIEEYSSIDDKESTRAKLDGEIWQGLESAFVSILLTLPSSEQAGILSDWLRSEFAGYPNLTDAFEIWCYRTKIARRRLAAIGQPSGGSML
ncbi:hypothetical protein HPP92_000831 [Vanilla planifolia]|uniref:BTB/POZ domain-containing protein n=1 Tax=Vanilla planifolia TaxID=51239 RepID=A0A835S3J6_VANPL|nr:hypothetical protein HPP92_000831 [Vanilla planifolia]